MERYILTKATKVGTIVLSKSKSLSYVNRRMYKDWEKELRLIKEEERKRSFFVNEYAFIEGIASWSITIG